MSDGISVGHVSRVFFLALWHTVLEECGSYERIFKEQWVVILTASMIIVHSFVSRPTNMRFYFVFWPFAIASDVNFAAYHPFQEQEQCH